ncbi:MAG: exodeoxyribonuclease V subunit beta [Gammaproteobacteria bacterium]|jgi:exodeoxyribonuclease V beta subunit|nr:exodeoxyribonuclease V subunit beta [Gammaproteobacteria bacterium]
MSHAPELDILTFPLRGSRLIEASAGTGKTFTLALLYTRLVLGHGGDGAAYQRPLMPPQILVVTFTVAATEELRERIRARLVEAAALFERPPGETPAADPPLLALRDDYPPADWPAKARLLRQAAEWMDEAMIVTIHGWCQRMLQEHAFATRGLFERELVTDQSELITELLRDYWRMHCYPLSPDEARCIRAVVASPEALQAKLGEWLKRRDAALCYQGEPLQCEDLAPPLAACLEQARLQEHARALWRMHRQELEQQLHELRPHLNGTKHDSANAEKFAQLLAAIADWADGSEPPDKLKHFAQGAFVFKKTAKVQEEPTHPAFSALAAWRRRIEPPADDGAPEPPTLEACLLAHAAAWIARELPKRLRQHAEMGFDELLRDLDAALNPPAATAEAREQAAALARLIRTQFPVALIDEFQDTDPIQYRIFDAVYRVAQSDPETALVMIGDPKQAIYGFRGADIHAYLAARRATTGRHYTLAVNFRSTKAVVSACNQLFGHAEQHPRGAFRFHTDPEAENPIPYVEITANGRADRLLIAGEPAPAMTFWRYDNGEAVTSPGVYLDQMAAAAASEVARWLTQARAGRTGFADTDGGFRLLKPKDIAILVRTGSEAATMRAALAARGIHSVYLSDRDSVLETQEACDLLHWLKACAAPTDEGLVRAALATNTFGLPLAELDRLQQDELGWEAVIERFTNYRRTWQRRGVLAMLRQLLHEQALPAQLLAGADGERVLTNLLHLAEWLQQAASALDGEQALIRHLNEHLGRGGDDFIVRLESDAELVQVITIHKSKGLEYPLVLLPFICSWRAVDGRTGQVPYRRDETPERYLEVAGSKAFKAAWDAADDERLSEDLRRFYVAVTRARHAVWLGIAPLRKQGHSPQLEQSAIGHVLSGGEKIATPAALWEALKRARGDCADIAVTVAPEAEQATVTPDTAPDLSPARTPSHAPFERWWIASYSALRLGSLPTAGQYAAGAAGSAAPTTDDRASALSPQVTAETAAEETALEEASSTRPASIAAAASSPTESTQPGSIPPVSSAARSIAARSTEIEPAATGAQPVADSAALHAFPRGSRYGTFLHGLLEWAATQEWRDADGTVHAGFAAAARAPALRRDMLARRCQLRGLTAWIDLLDRWLRALLTQPLTLQGLEDAAGRAPTLALQDLPPEQVQVEMEFWLASRAVDTGAIERLLEAHCLPGQARAPLLPERLNGMLRGFIDLVFEHDGRYYVLDWKSNWLGPDDSAYSPQTIRAAILAHRYDLQYVLYLLALHRQLRARLPGYDYDRDVGGVIYGFLRGGSAPSQGLFTAKPAAALIEALDALFAGQARMSTKVIS